MRLDPAIDQRLARWTATHLAHVSRDDAYAMGHTRSTLGARVRSGVLEKRSPRVFRDAGAPRTPEGDLYAATLDGPPGTVASYVSAAALFGWRPHPTLPHVTVPYGGNTRLLARVHRSRLGPGDRTRVGVIPATGPARTLVDCAAVLGADELAEVVDAALTSERTTREAVDAAMARASVRPGRAGTVLLREVLEAWAPGIRRDSVAEARLFRLLVAWGFPPPEPLHVVRDPSGAAVCEVDAAWPEALVALEYDSIAHHGPRQWPRDEWRAAAAEALGWSVVPVDASDLRPAGHDRLRSIVADLLGGARRSAA